MMLLGRSRVIFFAQRWSMVYVKETLPEMRLPWSFGEPINGIWIRRFHVLHVGSVHF